MLEILCHSYRWNTLCGQRSGSRQDDYAHCATTIRRRDHRFLGYGTIALFSVTLLIMVGCGTTKSFEATEQLILSDAVDDSVSAIDFRPLSGFKVFLDTEYLKAVKNPSFVNADYVISSLRQQIIGAGCLLQDAKDQADLIIEARVGTLGADAFQVIYGVPPNSALSTAAQAIPAMPPFPMLPELSFARRESREGAVKLAAFAYDRVTRQPVWQSGIARSSTTARDTWIMGVGPIQTGSIRKSTRVIGTDLEFGSTTVEGATPRSLYERPPVNYEAEVRFEEGQPILGPRLTSDGMLAVPPGTPGPAGGGSGGESILTPSPEPAAEATQTLLPADSPVENGTASAGSGTLKAPQPPS